MMQVVKEAEDLAREMWEIVGGFGTHEECIALMVPLIRADREEVIDEAINILDLRYWVDDYEDAVDELGACIGALRTLRKMIGGK